MTVVVEGAPGRGEQLRELAGLTWVLSRKNFRVRYKRAALGVVWAVLQPAFQAAVLTVVFLRFFDAATAVPHYPAYVVTGLLPWAFLAQSLSVGTTSVVDNASLVKKVALPLLVFPLSAVGGTGLAFAAGLPVLLVAGAVVGGLGPGLLLLPVALALELAVVVGLTTLTAALHPAFRDVRYLVESLLVVGLYLSPVLYDPASAGGTAQALLRLNPMTGVLSLFRTALLGRPTDLAAVGVAVVVTAGLLALGAAVFRSRSAEFADLV